MKFCCFVIFALLAVTAADLRTRNFTQILPIDDFPYLQKIYPGVKYVASFGGSRIIGGEPAEPGQFPYQAVLMALMAGKLVLCGGSIISTEYVLTAAHCVDFEPDNMVLGFGVHNLLSYEPEQVTVQVNRNNIIIHPKWGDMPIGNDIALIKLDEPITFTPLIQAVALPTRSQAFDSFEGDSGIATGWGQFSDEPTPSLVLQFVELPIISNNECEERLHNEISVPASVFCVDTINYHSTCFGDSGGPLVVNRTGTVVQVGITSFGFNNCAEGLPAGFTRVTSFLDFIEENSNIRIAP